MLLLISLLILPVLARSRGQLTACKSNLKNIGTALMMYSTDFDGHYPKEMSLLTPNYLKTIPTCPRARRDTYSESYFSQSEPDLYAVYCAGDTHTNVNLPANLPAYDNIYGLHDGYYDLGKMPSRCEAALEQRVRCIEEYKEKTGKLPADLTVVALSPTAHESDFLYSAGETDFQLFCPGAYHVGQGGEAFYPRYENGRIKKKSDPKPIPQTTPRPEPPKPKSRFSRMVKYSIAGLVLFGIFGLIAHSRGAESE